MNDRAAGDIRICSNLAPGQTFTTKPVPVLSIFIVQVPDFWYRKS
jgi:hypothetical protein